MLSSKPGVWSVGREHRCANRKPSRNLVDLVPVYPMYIAGLVCTDRISVDDKFIVDDIKAIIVFCLEVLKPGLHRHIFCMLLQFAM